MCSESQILLLQFFASWFMGFDYIFNERLRRLITVVIRKKVWRVERSIDADIKTRLKYIQERGPFIITAFIFVTLSACLWGAILLLKSWLNIWVGIGVFLLAVALLSSAIVELATAALASILPSIVYAIPSGIFKFIRYCPKGLVFGIGFVLLQYSFACRFYNSV